MRMSGQECTELLRDADHGVLATIHPDRGVDAVPVVYVMVGGELFVPVDTVKPKSGKRLQRLANIEADARCVVLVENWSDNWDDLWWVRAHGTGIVVADAGNWHGLLAARHPQYASPGTVSGGILIQIDRITGWAASAGRHGVSGN